MSQWKETLFTYKCSWHPILQPQYNQI